MLCFFLNHKDESGNRIVPRLEIQWAWFPYFIAADLPMQARIRQAWTQEWGGKLPLNELVQRPEKGNAMNDWILEWVALQYPGFDGLEDYLRGMLAVQQV